MRCLYIILIFYVVGSYGDDSKTTNVDPKDRCRAEVGLADPFDTEKVPAEQRNKFLCCLFLDGIENKDIDKFTAKLSSDINNVPLTSRHYTKEQLFEKINKCYAKAEKDSCKLVACLDVMSPPFSHYYFQT